MLERRSWRKKRSHHVEKEGKQGDEMDFPSSLFTVKSARKRAPPHSTSALRRAGLGAGRAGQASVLLEPQTDGEHRALRCDNQQQQQQRQQQQQQRTQWRLGTH